MRTNAWTGWVAALALTVVAAGCHKQTVGLVGKLEKHGGGSVALETLHDKVVVVNFWATWCGPCKQEIPDLVAVMKEYGPKGVVLLAANQEGGDAQKEAVEEYFLVNPKSDLRPYVVYPDDAFLGKFEVTGLPTTYVLDRKGKVVAHFVGAVPQTRLRAALEDGLKS